MGSQASVNDYSHFDLWAFCRESGVLADDACPVRFPRLESDPNVVKLESVSWKMTGAQRENNESTVQIQGTIHVVLQCVACGADVPSVIDVKRNLILVRSEQAAEQYDEANLGEFDDVVACDGFIDVGHWIEDEMLLNLPMVARHEACAQALEDKAESNSDNVQTRETGSDEPQAETQKPFADLDNLLNKFKH